MLICVMLIVIAGVCGSSPCINGGTCMPKGPDSYMCYCPDPFIGARCEVNPNHCASNPCMNRGVYTYSLWPAMHELSSL